MPIRGQAGVCEKADFKVALLRVPGPYPDWNRQPSFGLACLCAYLKANGAACRVFDARYHSWTTYELVKRVNEYRPHLIGLTATTHEINDAARAAQRLKAELSAPVAVGGAHATALPRRTLTEFPAFDCGINGEGEKPLLNLVERLRDGCRNLKYMEGIMYRDKEEVAINARPPALTTEELDTLPLPDFEDYYGDDPSALEAPTACYVTAVTRGTPHGGLFSLPVLGREVRWRSPETLIREMERALYRWGAHTFVFWDENLVFDAEEPRRFLEDLAGSHLPKRARWSGSARPGLISPEVVTLAAESGCFRLRLDVGSGDDGILGAGARGLTVERVRSGIAAIRAAGIEVELLFRLGYPGETEETIAETARLAAELNPEVLVIERVIPYPGTGVYEMALRRAGGYSLVSEDWSEYAWYGGKVLGLKSLPHGRLIGWQRRAVAMFYLKNGRPMDLVRYLWARRSALGFLLSGKLGIRLVARERFTG